ncbi:SDR family NAD(P)-dependent oxidoreductase [Kineococcus rhizosphaerae]|uniref:3-oxoacyl-[acyl-carrier protein] reductase n=1 Tax=Kineococcus rhizosphaerae TaxID=559628 RepID=A0A2T0QUX1_9ACTN|nr:SDR family NAD(P)-dependent oxidoreductase [Kineococcus rhizosphaerae]PRY08946.1 3-oxoacyl-[acyl-carrier protein] reductase [Kineococcus rhizosphaerae]
MSTPSTTATTAAVEAGVNDEDDQRRVAVITGASSGIGRAVAVELARQGVDVVIGTHPADAHDPELTAQLVADVGGRSVIAAVDVSSTAQVDAFVQAALNTWGRLDVVVANAGILRRTPLADMSDSEWNRILDVDLTGAFRLFRAAAPHTGAGGAFVGISSFAGAIFGWQEHVHYASAKAGMLGLIRSLAMELGPQGIRVNAVVPGTIDTPQANDPVNSLGPEGIAAQALGVPLRRTGRAQDVANVVRFLSSSDAAYITGQAVVVDGGLSVRMPG